MTTEKIEKIIFLLENARRGNADFMECGIFESGSACNRIERFTPARKTIRAGIC